MRATDLDALRQQLTAHENLRLFPYTDTVGKLTIGIGRNLTDRGISHAEARILLDNDINRTLDDLTVFAWFSLLDAVRQRVFVDLCFNMGLTRHLGFERMLAAAVAGQWETAAAELLDSRYAQQVGDRAVRLAAMLRTGHG